MTPPSLFQLMKRSFWFWFGGIWLAVGAPFFLIGAGLVLAAPGDAGGWIFFALGAAFGGIGGALFFRSLGGMLRERQLWREGTAVECELLKVAPTNYVFGGVTQWQIVYRYRDPRGAVYMGKSSLLPPEEARPFAAGGTGRARYDPRRPHLSIWTGDS